MNVWNGHGLMSGSRPIIDMTGRVYGSLTALHDAGRMPNGGLRWRFTCSCGAEVDRDGGAVRRGKFQHCGGPEHLKPANAPDSTPSSLRGRKRPGAELDGRSFGLLTVLFSVSIEGGRERRWRCVCACSNGTEVGTSALKRGQVKSCGCLHHLRAPGDGVDRSRWAETMKRGVRRRAK